MNIDSTISAMNDLFRKGYVIDIWTNEQNGKNKIGYKVSTDKGGVVQISSISPKQIFVKEMLLDMIKNGTQKDSEGNVDFLIYVDRFGKYSIIDNVKRNDKNKKQKTKKIDV